MDEPRMDFVNLLIDSQSTTTPTGPQASALSTRRPGASGR
jgi:hypothetical protein